MKKVQITDILILLLSAALCLGVKLVFHACDSKEDSSWMACHWAQQAVFASGISLTIFSVLRFFVQKQTKMGLSFATAVLSIITAFVPGVFISLCMMNTMRCHAIMRPAVILLCILLAIVSVTDILLHKNGNEAKT